MTSKLLNLISNYENKAIQLYQNNFDEQLNIVKKFNQFIETNPNCLSRDNLFGHITGSAFVINETFTKVLFTYHAKLCRWLQLGGHADGEIILQNVALKEAREESGIENFNFVDILNFPIQVSSENFHNIIPFDLDIHLIPERKAEPAHYHYDVRFILVAEHENFEISSESLDLKWIDLNDVCNYSTEVSTLRQVHKLNYLKNSH
ncbi:MAG: NUDIX hydrolase [Bdellovibrionota bacterium]